VQFLNTARTFASITGKHDDKERVITEISVNRILFFVFVFIMIFLFLLQRYTKNQISPKKKRGILFFAPKRGESLGRETDTKKAPALVRTSACIYTLISIVD
jgi:hypothetical protein